MRPLALITGTATLLALVVAGVADAAPTPEQKCQKARLDASAIYLTCHQKALGKLYNSPLSVDPDYVKLTKAMSKCRERYQETWPKLRAKASLAGSSCANPRFADNGDGTVTDNLTGLVWEKKTDDGTTHDKDNLYYWSTGLPFAESGSVFSSFLSTLNNLAFGGSRGWRLPTVAELQTILRPECAASPCIEAIFGPVGGSYSSSTSFALSFGLPLFNVLVVDFDDPDAMIPFPGGKTVLFSARAVRGGL